MLHHGSTDSSLHETTLTALVPTWDSGEETFVFPSNGEFVCGRSLTSAVRILVPGVAAEHCLVECREGRATILPIDQQVVSVNGDPVRQNASLEAGDVVSVGPAQFRVEARQPGRFCRPNVFARKKPSVSEQVPPTLTAGPVQSVTNPESNAALLHQCDGTSDAVEANASVEATLPVDSSLPSAPTEVRPSVPGIPEADAETIPSSTAETHEQLLSVLPTADTHVEPSIGDTANGSADADVSDTVDLQGMLDEIEDLKHQLQIANSDVDTLRQERDELQTAVGELKTAFEAVRDELIASQAYVLVNEDDRDPTSPEQSSEQSDLELQDALRTVSEQQDLIDTLQQQMSELAERFEAEAEAIRCEALASASESSSEGNAQLLEEIQQLKLQLSQAACESSDLAVDDMQVDGYQQIIRELKDQLQLAHQQLEQYRSSEDAQSHESESWGDPLPTMEAQEPAFQHSSQNPSLQESESGLYHAAGESVHQYVSETFGSSVEDSQNVDFESDLMVDSPTRKNFLDAFTELEDKADSSAAPVQNEVQDEPAIEPFSLAADGFHKSGSAAPAPERPSVRSEIAELFGITSSAFHEKPEEERRVSAAAELMSAVDDYSQEDSAAVSMSFNEAEQVLLRPKSSLHAAPEASSEEDDESHDDFVSQYMEQLLSRNRQSAGGSLPEELTRTMTRSERSVAEKPAVREKPKQQASFIDQYMSGAYAPMDASVDKSADISLAGTEGGSAVRPPRAKIDVQLLRRNMDSFREISSRSVENALATHARRRERGSLMKRATILGALSLLSLLIVVASMTGAIPFGIFAWLSLAAVAVSGGELVWKWKSIHLSAEQAAAKFSYQRRESEPRATAQVKSGEPQTEERNESVPSISERQPSPLNDGRNAAAEEHLASAARSLPNMSEELYFEQ